MAKKIRFYDPKEAAATRERLAAGSTYWRIDRDLAGASRQTKPYLQQIRDELFKSDVKSDGESKAEIKLNVQRLLKKHKGQKGWLSRAFQEDTGRSPGAYIVLGRAETGLRMVREANLRVGDVATLTAFSDRSSFSKYVKRWIGMYPAELRRAWRQALKQAGPPPEEPHDVELIDQLRRGEIGGERLEDLLGFVEAVHDEKSPAAAKLSWELAAERLVAMLRRLPWESQRRWIRDVVRVPSSALARCLLDQARSAKLDAKAALELALLSWEHIEAQPQALGDELASLRAGARVWCVHARARNGDHARAHDELASAWSEWQSDAHREPRIGVEIGAITAAILGCQGRHAEAFQRLTETVKLAQLPDEADTASALTVICLGVVVPGLPAALLPLRPGGTVVTPKEKKISTPSRRLP